MRDTSMTLGEALKKLNIEDFSERIFNSNSHGELIHIADYIILAEAIDDPTWFRDWFIGAVAWTDKNWKRPESVFQHIVRLLQETARSAK